MIIQAIQGRDTTIDADSHVIMRVQGKQWRIPEPESGIAVLSGSWTRDLRYYGGKKITGDVWVGKNWNAIHIQPRG